MIVTEEELGAERQRRKAEDLDFSARTLEILGGLQTGSLFGMQWHEGGKYKPLAMSFYPKEEPFGAVTLRL